VFDALKGRGGLRAEVVEEGVPNVGDAIEVGTVNVLQSEGFGNWPS
jgi:hypothetical protein